MFKITKAASKILKSTSNIKALAVSSIKAIDKYLNPSKSERFEDASHDFIFKKKLSEFVDFKATNSFSDFGGVQKEGTIDWAAVRKLIYARFADEIGARQKNDEDTKSHKINEHIETFTTYNIADEFNVLKSQGYDFAVARQAIQNQNVSKTLSERMKGLVVSGYMSNYGGESGLREEVEKLMHKKEYVMQELSLRVSELPACEVEFDQVKQVDILGDH